MNIEMLVAKKYEVAELIEKFYTAEVTQYLRCKKENSWFTFDKIYRQIGERFYTHPEIIQEIKTRYENEIRIIENQKRLKKSKKDISLKHGAEVSTKDRVFQYLKLDPTMSPRHLSDILMVSIDSVYRYRTIFRRIEAARQRQQENEKEGTVLVNEHFLETDNSELFLTRDVSRKCIQHLSSILSN
jgi:hypothetical protein